jgi:transcriptional regulator with XRE-family HTH domain
MDMAYPGFRSIARGVIMNFHITTGRHDPAGRRVTPDVPPLNVRDLGNFIRDQRKAAQISLRQLARQAGVSNPYLSQIERGLRKPSAEILQQIAKALRISAEVLYIQAGILDERSSDNDVVVSILADAGLTERQKQVIVEIYDAFRKENSTYGPVPAPSPVSPLFPVDNANTGRDDPDPGPESDPPPAFLDAAVPLEAAPAGSTAGSRAKRTTARKTARARAAGDPEPRTPTTRRTRTHATDLGRKTGENTNGKAPGQTGPAPSDTAAPTIAATDEPGTRDPAEDA